MSAPRIAPVTLESAEPAASATLKAVKAKIGMIPNLYATLAHSPAALDALLAMHEALSAGRLSAAEREIVALATAQTNGCQYCLSAHTLLGKGAGLGPEQIARSRAGGGASAREAAIASLAQSLARTQGRDSSDALDQARAASLSEGEIMEIVAGVAANVLTNYTNNLADTAIDFPVVGVQLAA